MCCILIVLYYLLGTRQQPEQTSTTNQAGNNNLGFNADSPPCYEDVVKEPPSYEQAVGNRSTAFVIEIEPTTSTYLGENRETPQFSERTL